MEAFRGDGKDYPRFSGIFTTRTGKGNSSGLHQFDVVAEGIVDEAPVVFFQRLVFGNGIARRFQCVDQRSKIVRQQRGMRFFRGRKILLDAKMKADAAGFKSASAAPGERCGLGHFGDAEKAVIECACCLFFARGHGQLDVFNSGYRHRLLPSDCLLLRYQPSEHAAGRQQAWSGGQNDTARCFARFQIRLCTGCIAQVIFRAYRVAQAVLQGGNEGF